MTLEEIDEIIITLVSPLGVETDCKIKDIADESIQEEFRMILTSPKFIVTGHITKRM